MNKLITVILSFLICFLALELFFSNFYPQNLQGYFGYQLKNGLFVNKKNFQYIHRKANKSATYNFGNYHNRINLNNKINRKNKNRILILGDSTTFGWLLDIKDTFVNKLQINYPEFHFINSSMPGWGSADYTNFSEKFCHLYKPKYTIIFLNTDDIRRGDQSNLYLMDKDENILLTGKMPIYKDYSKIKNFPIISFFLEKSHLAYFVATRVRDVIVKSRMKRWNVGNIDKDYPDVLINKHNIEKAVNKNIHIFNRLKNIIKQCESKLILMNLGWVDFNKINYKHKTKASPNAAFYLNAKKIFKKLEIIYIDNTDKMEKIRKNYKKYILSADNHPNELANEIIYDISKKYFNEIIFKNKIE